jgi:hypothetical protein
VYARTPAAGNSLLNQGWSLFALEGCASHCGMGDNPEMQCNIDVRASTGLLEPSRYPLRGQSLPTGLAESAKLGFRGGDAERL